MTMGFVAINKSVQEASRAICNKLDSINETLKNPLYIESRELYNRALINYNKGLYEEAIEDLNEAVIKNKTESLSYFLMGQIYLVGVSEFCNVIDLSKSIEALGKSIKYITSDAKNYPEVKPMAAEIWFYYGLAHQTKAYDELSKGSTPNYKSHLIEATKAYSQSWEYSNEMLESIYNLTRCKVLLSNDIDGAVREIISVIYEDHGYCLKMGTETDFDSGFKMKVYNRIKQEIYPKIKPLYDEIQRIKSSFQGPYSSDLVELLQSHLPDKLSENTPPFDMLEATVYFPVILECIKSEWDEFISNQQAEEQRRRIAERNRRETEERKRKEEEERKRREKLEEEERKLRIEQEKQAERKRLKILRGQKVSLIFILSAAIMLLLTVFSQPEERKHLGWAIFGCAIILLIYAGIYAYIIRTGKSRLAKIIWTILSYFLGVAAVSTVYQVYNVFGSYMATFTLYCYLVGCILAIIYHETK